MGVVPKVCTGTGAEGGAEGGAGTVRVGRSPDLLSRRTSTGITAPNLINTS